MTTIKLKKNSTSGEAPSASDLAVGEVAVNTADGLLYTKHTDNSIKTIGGGGGTDYSLPLATNTTLGGIELFNNTDQTVAANNVTTTANRTYGIQLNAANQAVVNVPWVDTNTVYTHPNHSGEVTSSADGATTIADNVVDEANLKVSNSPTNGYLLTAQSGNTGGLTWAENAAMPKAGGTFTGDVIFADYEYAKFGTDEDVHIGFNGYVGVINNYTSDLYIQNYADDKDVIITSDNGSGGTPLVYFRADGSTGETKLYYYGSEKIKTTTNGVDVSGYADVDNGMRHNGNLTNEILFGSNTQTFKTNGSNRIYITNTGVSIYPTLYANGAIVLTDTNSQISRPSSGNIAFTAAGAERARINSSGLDVTGAITVSGSVDGVDIAARDGVLTSTTTTANAAMPLSGGTFSGDVTVTDNKYVKFGYHEDVHIGHNGNGLINNYTNDLYIQNYDNDRDVIIKNDDGSGGIADYFRADGSTGEVQIYHYGTQKLASKSTGISVSGDIDLSGAITEEVYAVDLGSGTHQIDPSDDGGIFYIFLLANCSLGTTNLQNGQSQVLMIADGSGYTLTWPTMTWINNGGSAPTLSTTARTTVVVWKANNTVYGALVGDGT